MSDPRMHHLTNGVFKMLKDVRSMPEGIGVGAIGGAVIGFLVGGPPGAAIGAAVGGSVGGVTAHENQKKPPSSGSGSHG